MSPWFGLFLPQLRMSFPTILERTLAAEAAGFDSVWLMDHLAAPAAPEHDTFEGWTLASALAVRTTTIRIGHLVTCDPFRHPAVLAKMAATVDVLSDGRLELGLGWGSVERELETYGIGAGPPGRRAARMRETIEILDLMFAGEPFDHDGERASAPGRDRPAPTGAAAAATAAHRRRRAEAHDADRAGPRRLVELPDLRGRPSRRAPPARRQRPGLGAAPDRARARTRPNATRPWRLAERRFGGWGGLIAGTATEVADALAAEVATGVEGFVIQLTDFGDPETIDRFMTEVAPERSSVSRGKPRSGPRSTGSAQRVVTTLPRV